MQPATRVIEAQKVISEGMYFSQNPKMLQRLISDLKEVYFYFEIEIYMKYLFPINLVFSPFTLVVLTVALITRNS